MKSNLIKDEELMRRLNEYSRDCKWIANNRDELIKLFPDHLIAVKDMTVHYSETDMERICMIMELGGDEPAEWAIQYMNVEPIHFILATKEEK